MVVGLLVAGCGPAKEASPWSEPKRVSGDGSFAIDPIAAAHPAGVHMAWLEGDAESLSLMTRHFDVDSGHWGQTHELGRADAEPALAADVAGNAVVVWPEQGESEEWSDDVVYAARYDRATDQWSEPTALDVGGEQTRVVLGEDGAALALWTHSVKGEDPQLYFARMNPKGSWSGSEPIEGTRGARSYDVQLVLHADGVATAALRQEVSAADGSLESLLTTLRFVGDERSLAKGAWTPPIALQVVVDFNHIGVSLAGNARGDAALFWVDNSDVHPAIYTASRASSSDSWTEPDHLTTLGSCDGSISIDSEGQATVACSDTRTLDTEVNALRLNAERNFGPAELVSPHEYRHASDPAVLALDGRVLVAWSEGDGDGKFAMRSSSFREGSWHALELVGPIADGIPQPGLVAIPDVGVLAYWSTLDEVTTSWHR